MDTYKAYKIIAIVGPTASGKSGLAIKLAKKFNGEIVNADSRQVYKYLNIGTAKDSDDNPNDESYTVEGIRHHLIDFIDPKQNFTVAEFQKLAYERIQEITERGKVPFLVGGTGLWIDAICKNFKFKEDKQNWELRKDLETKTIEELYQQLEELNPNKANALNKSDRKNPRRLIRAIEKERIPLSPLIRGEQKKTAPPLNKGGLGGVINALYLSPKVTFEILEQRIYSRVEKMFEQGLLEENEQLLETGYTYDLPAMSGIGYKEFEEYFESTDNHRDNPRIVPTKTVPTIDEVKDEIKLRTRQYAKRQMTWFKRNEEIQYVDFEEGQGLIEEFLET